MNASTIYDSHLIRRYDRPGPRYTSYPTALHFSDNFGPAQYREAIVRSNATMAPLSMYVHVPFCASPCYYCGCTRLITRQPQVAATYLRRTLEEIARQAELFDHRRVVEQLHLGGGTPTYFTPEQFQQLMSGISQVFNLSRESGREFSIEIDPRTAYPGMMAVLAAHGFNRASLGVQDFDPDVQRAVNRIQTVEDTQNLIGAARTAGFKSVSIDLIYGLPLQTTESFARTLETIISLRPDRIAAYSYAHLPDRFKAQRRIRALDLPSADTKLELLGVTVDLLTQAGYTYIGMDHFALPQDELAVAQGNGTLQRNFQGYSTRGGLDLVGVGLSSIGKIADTYSQNFKTLDTYYAALDKHELPIERGLRISAEDRLRRDVIENLMCRGFVQMRDVERTHDIEFRAHFAQSLEQLRPMESDGLVEVREDTITVTPKGRFLLRAIAMAFDTYIPAFVPLARHSRVI